MSTGHCQAVLETAGFVISDDRAIWGIGLSHLEAWADLEDVMQENRVELVTDAEAAYLTDYPHLARMWTRRSAFSITPATAALLDEVKDRGGNIGWGIINGVFCTRDEQDGEEA